jgi:hypothetical protein
MWYNWLNGVDVLGNLCGLEMWGMMSGSMIIMLTLFTICNSISHRGTTEVESKFCMC